MCISSYLFFKKSFLDCLVVNNVSRSRKFGFKNDSRYFICRNFCFTSRSTASLSAVIADTSGATQTVVLDISKAFYRV